jgi:hypothetical protein
MWIGFQVLARWGLAGRSGEIELGNFDFVDLNETITRPDRMVCSCREELAYEVSGPESMWIGVNQ